MRFLGKTIFYIFSNVAGLYAAAYFVKNFVFNGTFLEIVIAASILTLINIFVRPVLKLIFGPFIILTFGIFLIFINALTLYILDILVLELTIQGYQALILSSLLIGFVNFFIGIGGRWLYKK